jgi:opacity protein-like surface antigen
MKSHHVILIFVFSFFCVSLNAQYFVGGNFGLNLSNTKRDNGVTTSKSTNYNFYLAPSVGKFLSEKVAIGLTLDISFQGGTTGPDPETKDQSTTLGVSPFLRYYAIKWNKFSVFGQGNIGFAFSNSSETTDGTKSEGPKSSEYGFNIYPGLSYDISDNLQLQTSINILRFGYGYVVTKEGSSEDRSSGFYMGAGLDNIISVSTITVGAIYKF